jgi:curved DNA-binding protein
MGLDRDGGATGATGAGRGRVSGAGAGASEGQTGPATTQRRPASAEAVAEISLEEAYHGTTRLVEVEGKRLEITIPKGADSGTRLRLTGKAPGGGDLHVVVRQQPDRRFTRRGADLERELPLTLAEALLGAEVPVRTLKGRVLLTIPAGTQHGRTFRLKGQGMPRFRAEGFGDLYAKARIILPTDLSDDARSAAERFTRLADQPDPRSNET